MRRTERLFALAEYLRGRRTGVTATQLAERFDVTLRTIYRDLDTLRAAHMPIHAEPGRGGGFALDRSYALPPVNFSAREAAVLSLASEFLIRLRVMPFDDTLTHAIEKVRAALPAASQRELAQLSERLQFVGVPAHTAPAAARRVLETAWIERTPVWIEYDGARGKTQRVVRIESVVLERTETLLNAIDLEKNESRQFRLHKILRARPAHAGSPAT